MKKKSSVLFLSLLLFVSALAVQSREAIPNDLRDANDAWLSGNYTTALQAYLRLLKAPNGEQYIEPIAIQTGELPNALCAIVPLTVQGCAPLRAARMVRVRYQLR